MGYPKTGERFAKMGYPKIFRVWDIPKTYIGKVLGVDLDREKRRGNVFETRSPP